MKCPGCGLYHPAFYERCVACGVSLQAPGVDIEKQRKTNQNQAVPNQVVPSQTAPNQTTPNQTTPNQGVPNQAVFNQTIPSQAVPYQVRPSSVNEPKRTPTRFRYGSGEETRKDSEKKQTKGTESKQIPTRLGVLIALTILLVCAGVTIFILSKSPDDKRLIELGKHQLSLDNMLLPYEH